jgi:HAD superfamily phosphatase (TIGR01668 family)
MKQHMWYPHYVARSILDIDTPCLQQRGITHLVFDLDNTLVHHGSSDIRLDYSRYLDLLKDRGFTILIGTNRRHGTQIIATMPNLPAVGSAGISYKPLPSFYKRLVYLSGTSPAHIAMVGDRVLNDVIGARIAGFTTILVEPLARKTSAIHRWYVHYALQGTHR